MSILVSEVGPRDGLQSVKRTMPTAAKLRWIRALAASGLREIEVASFVPAKLMPQMADAAEVVREATAIPGLTVLALAPNLRGVEDAIAAGAHKVTLPVSASHAHSLANVRMTCDEAIEHVGSICAFRASLPPDRRPGIEIGISTAFGCTMQGEVSEDWVMEVARRLAQKGVDSIGLSDTVGYADPSQVKRMFLRLKREIGHKVGGAHFHNTRGQGLANVVAALDAGVTTFDASQGGIGGCPHAPGASGNIVTEDLVYLLESMGLDTAIDLDRLIAAREILKDGLPGEPLYGHVPDAGRAKNFKRAVHLGPSSEQGKGKGKAPLCPSVGLGSALLALEGVCVVEFSHMVMGPSCGLILADLGAEVIKVEPEGKGDPTRYLESTGAGFFAAFNRNKKSVSLDIASPGGIAAARKLVETADVFIENFRPDALERKGLGYDTLSAINPRLVYCSLKGFLPGPYEKRTALDEVVQMLSGLAYMTGPVGQPLRAGASVNDMMGGMFGAIAIIAALRARDRTGRGQYVQSGLFENAAWLMSTHMMQHAVSGKAPEPMPAGKRAWGVYDVFESADGARVFIGVVTERQWEVFTKALGEPELMDTAFATNNQRSVARQTLIPLVSKLLAKHSIANLERICEEGGLPFARILKPSDLFEDAHLNAGGMLALTLPDGSMTKIPALPIALGGQRLALRSQLPEPGQHNAELMPKK
jgi:crotonobetainyl-CoA:carnitine CoA-transferase CaiB-like acyl-CoA transferase